MSIIYFHFKNGNKKKPEKQKKKIASENQNNFNHLGLYYPFTGNCQKDNSCVRPFSQIEIKHA